MSVQAAAAGPAVQLFDPQHGDQVNSIAFSRDGRFIVTAGNDYKAKVWRAEDFRFEREFVHLDREVNRAFFSHNGSMVVTVVGATITVWDCVGVGFRQKNHHPHPEALWQREHISAADISFDDHIIAYGDNACGVNLWSLGLSRRTCRLRGHGRSIEDVAFSPDGRTVASVDRSRVIRLWSVDSGECKNIFSPEDLFLGHAFLTFASDGKRLICSAEFSVQIWNIESGTKREIAVPLKVCSMTLFRQLLLLGTDRGQVLKVDLNRKKVVETHGQYRVWTPVPEVATNGFCFFAIVRLQYNDEMLSITLETQNSG